MRWAPAALVVISAFVAACGGNGGAEPLTLSGCTELRYGGSGKPNVVVVSDLPRRGVSAEQTRFAVDAIEFVLRRHNFRGGHFSVGYQSCNDSVGDEPFDTHLCRVNARAYVASKDVVGVIGPWNSGCAIEQIPIVSRRAAGPLAMISPFNTFAGLTLPASARDVPNLYPDGVRSYVRVVTHDLAQGAAAAEIAKREGALRVAVVHQPTDSYARGLASSFRRTAPTLGLEVREFPWRLLESYRTLARSVAATQPDAVFLAGVTEVNAKQLVADLRAALGPGVTFIAPDSFAGDDFARDFGAAGEGMRVTLPGFPPEALPRSGKRFRREFGAPGGLLAFGAPEAAQATEVLLEAIARSDGTRASVVRELFATRVKDGILGSFSFDGNGDIVPRPVGIYRYERGKFVTEGVVRVPLGEGR